MNRRSLLFAAISYLLWLWPRRPFVKFHWSSHQKPKMLGRPIACNWVSQYDYEFVTLKGNVTILEMVECTNPEAIGGISPGPPIEIGRCVS